MRLTVLGAAGSYPTAIEPGAGFLVETDTARIVLDLGPGTFRELAARLPIHAVDAIVISHGHADHCADLLAWYHAARYGVTPRAAVPLFAPDDVVERVGAFLRKDPEEVGLVFDHRPVEPGSRGSVAGVDLRFGAVDHPVPAVATRLEADGRSVLYTGDTAPTPAVVELGAGVDLFVCEATALTDPMPGLHCDVESAASMALEAGAGALLLTHLLEDVDHGEAIAIASATFDGLVSIARSGLSLSIG